MSQSQAPAAPTADALSFLRDQAPWLFAPQLGACLVGSQALLTACRQAKVPGPEPADIDLSWALDLEAGKKLLTDRGVAMPTTDGNLERGTLAMKLGGQRIEITTFRAGDVKMPLDKRITADLQARDMTIGAVAIHLTTGAVVDPCNGLADWQARRIVACGDAKARVQEHPVRWLRYYRKAHQFGFEVDRQIRKLDLPLRLFDAVPREAIAAELRAGLLLSRSPGRFFLELYESGVLGAVSPEIATQFDGRPAGPQRWHPEVGQALHMCLAFDWAVERCAHLDERDRAAVFVSVLLHDLGKGYTSPGELPGHPGHERLGVPIVKRVLEQFPGLADARTKALALQVCELHVEIRHLRELRPGTLVQLYDRQFRAKDWTIELFALAVGADSGGRLGMQSDGDRIRERLCRELHWLRERCESVDAEALKKEYADVVRFKAMLHEARCRALLEAPLDGEAATTTKDGKDAAAS